LKDFRTARKLREHINSAIETAILQKRINNINEASVRLNVTPDIAVVTGKFSSRFADFLMVSKVETMIKNLNAEGSIRVTSNDMNGGLVQIEVGKTNLYRCPRCWRHVSLSEDTLCSRCQPIVDNWSENNISL
jgi:isoleucyl-tRNA synthetase